MAPGAKGIIAGGSADLCLPEPPKSADRIKQEESDKMQLSEKEKKMYEYISDMINSEGYPPTVRDIQAALHIKSTSTVHSYLAKLEEKGYIRRDHGKSRSVRVENGGRAVGGGASGRTGRGSKEGGNAQENRTIKVPLVGKVAAGTPILAVENNEGYIDFPTLMGSQLVYEQLFALRVAGTSMIGAGIMDRDIVVVSKCSYAENGEIVVALLDEEATVKRFFKENGHFRLQPENPELQPIITNEVYILGKVIAVVRYYK